MGRDAEKQKPNSERDDNEKMVAEQRPEHEVDREAMTLIPWTDIWASLTVARHRGDGEMVAVFYDTLFKEAVFDDHGAWAWYHKRN